jgi:arginyl-tRNA synthetase
MKTVRDELEARISAAMQAYAPEAGICQALVTVSTAPQFGDYQANGVIALARKIHADPLVSARAVIGEVSLNNMCEHFEVAGPGFINLRLKPDFVAERLVQIWKDPANLGIDKTSQPKTIVVDFSSPNIAKEMHVGHLRSTIIGDCICRMLEFLGHKVIRQNHIGDWGTPMGMVIFGLATAGVQRLALATSGQLRSWQQILAEIHRGEVTLSDLEEGYKQIASIEKGYPAVAANIRQVTNSLQKGDLELKAIWEAACDITLRGCSGIYSVLSVALSRGDVRGESFYKDMLPDVVDELLNHKIAVKSEGAICVFPPGFKTKEGKPLPFMIQKSDGAYLYATTDLAALRYRVRDLRADAIIYVTDARQKLHFEMLFATARMAGWDIRQRTEDGGQKTELVHVTFGSVLGDDGTPLKTREGENVKLKDLLDEAVQRARKIVEDKNPELPLQQKEKIAKAVGIGAVKYADFSNSRTSDYVFSFDKMLAMDGNTAPYMQYAYARIKSIERKAQSRDVRVKDELAGIKKIVLDDPAELNLAKHLIRYGEAIDSAVGDYRPNYLTSYLYELAQKFSVFYTNCPVLDAGPDKRPTRLLLCDVTAQTIEHGLKELLGIEVIEQM